MKVSVIIPCYNQAHYLEESVQSALDQTYPDIEIIIVNDGSPDNTQEVADRLQKKYPDIVRVVTQENKGLSEARNSGIKEALGKYILPLDADDILDAKLVSHCMSAITKNNADIVYFDLECFGEYYEIAYKKPFSKNNILYENIAIASSFYHKNVWEKIGGYKQNMNIGYEDWEFWINAYKHGFIFHYLPEVLFYYRTKKESMHTEAYKRDVYLKAKIVMNHPELYTPYRVDMATQTIKETEQLPDLYFYTFQELQVDIQLLTSELDDHLRAHGLSDKETFASLQDNIKIQFYTLEIFENEKELKEIVAKYPDSMILFYAPLRYTIFSLRCLNVAWDKAEGFVPVKGTVFGYVTGSKREDMDVKLLAYERQECYISERLEWLEQVREGKDWLEEQYYSLTQALGEKDQEIAKLQEGKDWLEGQVQTQADGLAKIRKSLEYRLLKKIRLVP